MCGIAGIIGNISGEERAKRLGRMMAHLSHRGPDDHGIFSDEWVSLGHHRLSIIDLSAGGHQPMQEGPHVVVYNGEIYNYPSLKEELSAQGYRFRTKSDTEVLLAGYRLWGDELASKIDGMYAFAIWDVERRRLFCGRDPFGKKPFYYVFRGGTFVFASEVEALVAGLDSRPGIDFSGMGHYLLKGYFAPGRSVYSGVETLRAGHCLEFDPATGKARERQVTPARFELGGSRPPGGWEGVLQAFSDRFGAAVQKRFLSDVPVGVLLSGGVDSSLVALFASEVQGPGFPTFTVTFRGTRNDESSFASRVAAQCRSAHNELNLSMDDVPSLLPRLIKAYGEPFGDDSAIPTYCIFQAIRCRLGLKVSQTGDGGDEVFAGYGDAPLFWLRGALSISENSGRSAPAGIGKRLLASRRRLFRECGYALLALTAGGAELFQSLRPNGWTKDWRKEFMRDEAFRLTGGEETEREDARNFEVSGRSDFERYLNQRLERLTQEFLVKVDRASMAHSIEVRCPMLDMDLFRWAAALSRTQLAKGGVPKRIPKDVLAKWMGKSFARRRKVGFTPPLDHWFRQEDAIQWMRSILTRKDSLAYMLFPPESVERLIALHKGGLNQTGRLWKLIFLSEWYTQICGGVVPREATATEVIG